MRRHRIAEILPYLAGLLGCRAIVMTIPERVDIEGLCPFSRLRGSLAGKNRQEEEAQTNQSSVHAKALEIETHVARTRAAC